MLDPPNSQYVYIHQTPRIENTEILHMKANSLSDIIPLKLFKLRIFSDMD